MRSKIPLTPIQLSAQRLRKKFFEKAPDFDAIFNESTEVIVNEVGSLKQMIDEFSKFARLPLPQMARQSLHDVMREVVALYSGAHRDIRFQLELDESLPLLNFDKEQLKRVFVNLFDNAIQAMNQKGRSVLVTTRYDTKKHRAVVSVADEGIGDQSRRPRAIVRAVFFSQRKQERGWDSRSCIASLPIMMDKSRPPIINRRALSLRLNCRCSGRRTLFVNRSTRPVGGSRVNA